MSHGTNPGVPCVLGTKTGYATLAHPRMSSNVYTNAIWFSLPGYRPRAGDPGRHAVFTAEGNGGNG